MKLAWLLAFLAGASSGRSAERTLIWPIEARISPTSAFCEYRPLRYHAGIDLSTGGRIGMPILAVADGYVWRVHTSPYGYGKVIYQRLEDGRTAVYAHLSEFNDAIERLVQREQLGREAYTVDLSLRPGQVRVRRGEVIAWSGSTGIGAPHLHFEIRDAENRPLNPLANGLALADDIPPTMVSLAFLPLSAQARINGVLQPYTVPLANYDSVWTSKHTPTLWGPVGVALMAWDRTPHGRYRLSVHAMTLSVDGNEVFRRRYDRLSLTNQLLSAFDRNFALVASGEGRYYNLYLPPGNTLDFYDDLPTGSGVLVCGAGRLSGAETFLEAGRHELRFTAADFGGTSTQGSLTVTVGRTDQLSGLSITDSLDAPMLRIVTADTATRVRLWAADDVAPGADQLTAWSELPDSATFAASRRSSFRLPSDSVVLYVVLEDTLGHRLAKVVRANDLRKPPKIELAQMWGRDWLRLDVKSSRPLTQMPTVRVTWPEEVVVRLESAEVSAGLYETEIAPEPSWPENYGVRVLSGRGRPTVVAHWIGEREIRGVVELVPGRDSLSALYQGVIAFEEAFPESGVVRVSAEGFDTTFAVSGKVLGSRGGEYTVPDLSARIEFGRGVIADPMFVRLNVDTLQPSKELQPVGSSYRFEPQDCPLVGEATITVRLPDTLNLRGVALYGVSPRRAECLAVADKPFDHTLRARVPSLYTVGVYRDTTPPTIRITSPRPGMIVRVRRPLLVATVRDEGSGFPKSDDAMEMRLNESWVPAEYDPEKDTLTYRPPASLPPGRYTVVVRARDQVGNEHSTSLDFSIE